MRIEFGAHSLGVQVDRHDVVAREGDDGLGDPRRRTNHFDASVLRRVDGVGQLGEEPAQPMFGHDSESGIERAHQALVWAIDHGDRMMDYTAFRAEKDQFFRDHPQSPLPPHERHDFEGLRYFEPNPHLDLELEPTPTDGAPIMVQTSDGQVREYHRAATVSFDVAGEEVTLTLLSQPERPGYFLAFRDGTSGEDTYGAGRYLDLDEAQNGTVHIDFNMAYNPYCAYNDAYSCPLPPHENWLRVPIEAGEKDYRADG